MDLVGTLDYDWYDSEDCNDPKVYEMLRNGDTTDVFQLAGFMATKLLNDFDVHNIDGINAVNAGNRPGPLEKNPNTGKSMTDLYTERAKTKNIPSLDKRIDNIMSDTYGCMWYQEHCMSLGRVMAGYSMGNADNRIRKVLGKKKVKMIPEIRNEFIYGKKSLFNDKHEVIGISDEPSPYCEGALARGFDENLAKEIFLTMEAFAKYSFNKSHSLCYGILAYKTAWLSCYHPVEFAIANCTINDDSTSIVQTLSLAKKRKIPILGPNINNSKTGFSCEVDCNTGEKQIRYGLRAIKGVGEKVVKFITGYKDITKVSFKDFDDYYTIMHNNYDPVIQKLINDIRQQTGKNSTNPLNKGVEVALILAGAFDYSEPDRYKLLKHYLIDIKKEKTLSIKIGEQTYTSLPKFNRKEKLSLEKEYMGTYISEHPLDSFAYEDFESSANNSVIKTTLLVTSATIKDTKKKTKYLVIKGLDKTDTEITVNVFGEDKALSLKNDIKKNSILIVTGKVNHQYNNITANEAKIAVKQTVKTEDITINEQLREEVQETSNDILQDALNDIFNLN